MEKIKEQGIVFKTSRISFIHNYILISLVGVVLLLIFPFIDFRNILHFLLFFGLLIIAAGLGEEPEWERVFRKYIVTKNEIIKFDGIIRKKKMILPYQSIADVRTSKGIIGRILNFGVVDVVGFKDSITMKGMKNPEEIQDIIQNKINEHRGGSIFKPRIIRKK